MKISVIAWLLCALIGSARAEEETIVPLPNWKIGLVNGQDLRCVDLQFEPSPHWTLCPPSFQLHLPSGTVRVLGNERTFAILSVDRADFYDESGERMPRSQIKFPVPMRPGTFINGAASTETELTRIDQGRFITSNAVDPQSDMNVAIDCAEAIDSKVYDFRWSSLALVGRSRIVLRDLRKLRGSQQTRLRCFPSMYPDFEVPQNTDEVFLYRYEYIGVRQGQRLRFFTLNPTLGWVAADSPDQKLRARVPDFQMP